MTAAADAGTRAEQLAEAFLLRRGLRILARNYRVPGGEIDLVAEDDDTVTFVEVRLRANSRHGGALESIDRRKRRRLALAPRHWLARLPGAEPPCRFDAVLVLPVEHNGRRTYAIEWLRDAFGADDC